MKKLVTLFAVCFLVGMIISTASAISTDKQIETSIEINIEKEKIESVVEDFLQKYAAETILFRDADFSDGTIKSARITALPETIYQLPSDVGTILQLQDNITFYEEKATYFKEIRKLQNIYCSDLELSFCFEYIEIEDDFASVQLVETAKFYYEGETRRTVIETVYNLDLVKIDGQWLIADITDNDWFDAAYKNDTDFRAKDAINSHVAMQAEAKNAAIVAPDTLDSYVNQSISYNRNNAVAYAYTYTTGAAGYNSAFLDLSGSGGDCMNFASQCIWAGFSGNQQSESMSAFEIPMDAVGSDVNLDRWFTAPRTATQRQYSNSWAGTISFPNYVSRSIADSSSIGIKGIIVTIPAGSDFSEIGYDYSLLEGAIALVDGLNSANQVVSYGHAIVLTEVNGYERSDIYFCGHTANVNHYNLGSSNPNCSIKVIIPLTFQTGASVSDRLFAAMLEPTTTGSTEQLRCYSESYQSSMSIAITAPSGAHALSSAQDVLSCTFNYTFSEAGLYKIDCSSRKSSDSASQFVTYYILVQ